MFQNYIKEKVIQKLLIRKINKNVKNIKKKNLGQGAKKSTFTTH